MKYETEGCSFTIPDELTVRQQLRYSSVQAFATTREKLILMWEAAKTIIDDWECESIPDYEAFDLDASTDTDHTRIIGWAGLKAWTHMQMLGEIPKK